MTAQIIMFVPRPNPNRPPLLAYTDALVQAAMDDKSLDHILPSGGVELIFSDDVNLLPKT